MEFTNRVSSPFPRTAWAVCTRHLGRNTVKTVLLSYTQCSYCLGSGAPGHTDRRSQAVACAQLNAQRGQTRGTNRGQSLSSCLCVHSCSLPPPAWLADWALGPCWFYPPLPFFRCMPDFNLSGSPVTRLRAANQSFQAPTARPNSGRGDQLCHPPALSEGRVDRRGQSASSPTYSWRLY